MAVILRHLASAQWAKCNVLVYLGLLVLRKFIFCYNAIYLMLHTASTHLKYRQLAHIGR